MRRDWRTVGVAILVPIEVLAVAAGGLHLLVAPKHGGWYVAAALVLLGGVFGLRAVLLPVAGCITLFLAGQTECTTQEHCAEGFIWLYAGLGFSIPVVVGAILGWLGQSFASRFAKPS